MHPVIIWRHEMDHMGVCWGDAIKTYKVCRVVFV